MSAPLQSFISTVPGTLDAKGRVCIPALYRQILAAQNTNGVYVCPSLVEDALDAFGEPVISQVNERLATLDPFLSPSHEDQALTFIARTHLLPLDEQGRVRVPDPMIARAGLRDKVTFVGMGRKFQIWDSERYAPVEAASIARVKAEFERARAKSEGGA